MPSATARVNDAMVSVETIVGDVPWHAHDDEDKFFYVVDGRFVVELPERVVELLRRQSFMVPKGVRHRTYATEPLVVMVGNTPS